MPWNTEHIKMLELKRTFIYVGEDMYEVVRMVKDDPSIEAKAWRDILHADTTFRKDGMLFFVNKVEDAVYEPITENVENEITYDTGQVQ